MTFDDLDDYVAPSGHGHTLTVTDDGRTYITEHLEDPGFTLLSGCHVYKVAHQAFEAAPEHRRHTPRSTPPAGVYRIALGDDSNLHVFGRIPDEVPA